MYTTLIDAKTLLERRGEEWSVIDCRFDLADPGSGRRGWLEGHIPGSVYAHLDEVLSNPPWIDHGRHPLPPPEALVQRFSRLGLRPGVQVVAYDDSGGCFAARLWWLLRFLGHEPVAVLDGGLQAWIEAGGELEPGEVKPAPGDFTGTPRSGLFVTLDQVLSAPLLIDARDPARYRGELEPIDRVPGHIPGAVNRFWQKNLDTTGRFLPAALLAREFRALLGELPAEQAVCYCGSGVTACHDILAMVHAGLGQPRLYCGSWSEWCADPARPVATD